MRLLFLKLPKKATRAKIAQVASDGKRANDCANYATFEINMRKHWEKTKTWARENWPLWVLLLISAVVYHRWLSFDFFYHYDLRWSPASSMREWLDFSVWVNNVNTGLVNITLWMLAPSKSNGLLGLLGFDLNIAQKITTFWPFIILTPLSMFLLLKKIFRENISAFVGALFFTFNTYFLSINGFGHFYLTLAIDIAIISLYFLMKAIEEKSYFWTIIASLVLFLAGTFDFRFVYLSVPFFFLLILVYFFSDYSKNKLYWKKFFLITFLYFGIILLLNISWVIPFGMASILTENAAISRDQLGNNFLMSIANALTATYPFWKINETIEWLKPGHIYFWSWLIPLVVLLGFWRNRRNKLVAFFAFMSIAGIFLVKQDVRPWDNFYDWIYKNIPWFNMFREPTKFFCPLLLGYAVLIGGFIFSLDARRKYWKYFSMRSFFALGLSVIFLLNTWPVFSGKLTTMYSDNGLPWDEIEFYQKEIEAQPDFFRTFYLRVDMDKTQINSSLHPEIISWGILQGPWQGILPDVDGSVDERYRAMVESGLAKRFFTLNSIKYIFSDKEEIFDYQDFKQIGKLGPKYIFENENPRPHIYLTEEKESLIKEITIESVDVNRINSSHYTFKLKNIDQPVYLNFTDQFHPQWSVRVGKFRWWQVLFEDDYFLPAKYHFENEARLNAFFIDPDAICQVADCEINPDGSRNMDVTLFFVPQSYYYGGLIFSGSVLLACLVYLGFCLIGKKNNE